MKVLIRGGGDLASGVALRLFRAGFQVIITELPQPMAVRRLVSFGEAVYSGEITVEEVTAQRAKDYEHAREILSGAQIPVLIDPEAESRDHFDPRVLVDGRMTKRAPDLGMDAAALVIGLGPGFVAGKNCHAAVETNRGHRLGRVIWQGAPQTDTGTPDSVANHRAERVLRAPADGIFRTQAKICDHLEPGDLIAEIHGEAIRAPFRGVLRGLLHSGLVVRSGLKVGDLDPRDDPSCCTLVSDKALAVGGGVMEAILSRPDLRPHLWN
jgi:xanthine dehydrogenase accessory factor